MLSHAYRRAAIGREFSSMKEILEEVGRGADASSKERDTLRQFADELVADRVANEAMKDNFEKKMFSCFDSLYNRHKNRTWRMWDNPEQEYEVARKRAEEVLEAFCVDQLYVQDDDDWPEGYTPITWIEDARRDELREKFNVLIQSELSWAVENRKDNSTHNTVMLVALIIFLGHDELIWLVTNPLYLLLFLLAAGAAGAYYFQQKVGNLAQVLQLVGIQLPGSDAGNEARPASAGGGVTLKQFEGQASGASVAAAGRRVQSYPGPRGST